MSSGWSFSPRSFNDVEQEVTEADQFNSETVTEVDALVREALQNSQDARAGIAPVRVRIAWADESTGLTSEYLDGLTGGLVDHIKASGFPVPQDGDIGALIVEDFGTRGLTGSFNDEGDEDNFRSFWFRHGGSFKKGSKGGRWGLGKLVFPMASLKRCFFGLTVRDGESAPLLMGQAVLKTHRLGDVKYAPHGHFADTEVSTQILPIDDVSFISKFNASFGLSRKAEPGLSVVVPYCAAKPSRDELVRYVVANYAYPILTGRLEVDVLGETVNAAAVMELGRELLPAGLIDFIQDVHDADHANLISADLPRTSENSIPEDTLGAPLDELQQRYAAGELLGFRIDVTLTALTPPKTRKTFFEVFLRAAGAGELGSAIFVRGEITIPGEASKRFQTSSAFAALLATDEAVSAYLGDGENPAHTDWAATKKLRANWSNGTALHAIRVAPAALHRLLAVGQEQEDPDALLAYFWLDDPGEGPKTTRRKKKAPPKAADDANDMPKLPPNLAKFTVAKLAGGFELKIGPGLTEFDLPCRAKVEVAYDVEFGNALTGWDRLDFDLSNKGAPTVTSQGGVSLDLDGNVIELEIETVDFSIRAEGFDTKRDLVVQAKVKPGASDAE